MIGTNKSQGAFSALVVENTEIQPESNRSLVNDLKEIWQFRRLFSALALRDIQVRYRQSVLGILWIVIQPIITCLVFTFVFGHLVRIDSGDTPYPVFVFSGLLLWQFFSRNLSDGVTSLVGNSSFINKVYFPRIGIPIISILSSTVDFLLALLVLIALMFFFEISFYWQIVFTPVILLATLALSYSWSLIFSPLNAIYRDIGFAITYGIQFLMYLSPVIYPVSFIPKMYQWIYDFNPIATLLNAMRWALIGTPPPNAKALFIYAAITLFSFVIGRKIFRSLEPTIVDRI